MDTIYFFAIKEDLNNIFGKIEEEFDIKYCVQRAEVEIDDTVEPQLEYDSIKEIVNKGAIKLLIAEKTEELNTYYSKADGKVYYKTVYHQNKNSVVFLVEEYFPR